METVLKTLLFFFIVNTVFTQSALAAKSAAVFDTSKYKEECGGKVYPQCDSAKLNQLTIYKEAEALAASKNLDIVLIMGADWCPPCNSLEKAMSESPEVLDELQDKLLIVALSGDTRATSTSRDLMNYLGTNIYGYPTVFRINKKDKSRTTVMLKSYSDIHSIVNSFTKIYGLETLKKEAAAIEYVSKVPVSFLDKAVDLSERYGQYPYFKTGGSFLWRTESEVDKLVNAGLARIHAFQYLDAVRCFKNALKLDSGNALAKSFLALSYTLLDGGGQSSTILANMELAEVTKVLLSNKESAWIDFIKAYVFEQSANLTGTDFDMSTQQSFEKLINATDGDAEVLTLAYYLINGAGQADTFLKALSKKDDHLGANHYLIHHYEESRDFYRAKDHAQKMASIALDSAHAQHMYGHILPRFKDWESAKEQFSKAADLHKSWSEKYKAPESYDWHYSHNLDLMGATYVGLGKSAKALEAFKTSCPYDSRACTALLKLSSSLGDNKSIDDLFNQWGNGQEVSEEFNLYFERYKIEANLLEVLKEDKSRVQKYLDSESRYFEEVDKVIKKMIRLKIGGTETLDSKLMEEVKSSVSLYAADRLSCSSFDGWGKGMLDFLRLWKVANLLGYDKLSQHLSVILKDQLGMDVTKKLKTK